EDCKNYELHKKIESYKKSDLKLVTEFVSESEAREHKWDDSLIKERTDGLALETFAKI
ncbi:TPA: hypothetical protein HIY68_004831, partial [Escherichia coli]|nr:hypothetical protein [Escherichia coli]